MELRNELKPEELLRELCDIFVCEIPDQHKTVKINENSPSAFYLAVENRHEFQRNLFSTYDDTFH
uniref:Uncharacterized protein n=1 Tax=Ascaris lumbricoides TaxID=6252 RepID=A0A0M3I3P4_ASCLU